MHLVPFISFAALAIASPFASGDNNSKDRECCKAQCYKEVVYADSHGQGQASDLCRSYAKTLVTPCPATVYQTKTVTKTVFSDELAKAYKHSVRDDVAVVAAQNAEPKCTPSTGLNSQPSYADKACHGTDFGAACACLGYYQPTTSTLPTSTRYSTVCHTTTITKPHKKHTTTTSTTTTTTTSTSITTTTSTVTTTVSSSPTSTCSTFKLMIPASNGYADNVFPYVHALYDNEYDFAQVIEAGATFAIDYTAGQNYLVDVGNGNQYLYYTAPGGHVFGDPLATVQSNATNMLVIGCEITQGTLACDVPSGSFGGDGEGYFAVDNLNGNPPDAGDNFYTPLGITLTVLCQ